MLVLNTNKGGDGGFTIANQDIIPAYPNPEGNILMAVDKYEVIAQADTAPTKYVLDINGTKIHQITPRLILPDDLIIKGNQGYQYPPIISFESPGPSAQGSTKSCLLTIGLEKPFEAGNVIGKRVIFPCMETISDSNSYLGSNYIKNATYTIGVIHSDGTKTTIATKHANNDSSTTASQWTTYNTGRNNSSNRYAKVFEKESVAETAGYTTIDGDYLIVDIAFDITKPTSSTPTVGLFFGCFGPTMKPQQLKIFQVSVE